MAMPLCNIQWAQHHVGREAHNMLGRCGHWAAHNPHCTGAPLYASLPQLHTQVFDRACLIPVVHSNTCNATSFYGSICAKPCAGCTGLAAMEGAAGGVASLPAGAAAHIRRARTWVPELSFPDNRHGWPWFPVLELGFSRKTYPGKKLPNTKLLAMEFWRGWSVLWLHATWSRHTPFSTGEQASTLGVCRLLAGGARAHLHGGAQGPQERSAGARSAQP